MSRKAITHLLALAAWGVFSSSAQQCLLWSDPPGNITFNPSEEEFGKMTEGEVREVLIEIPQCGTNNSELTYQVFDRLVADVASVSQLPPDASAKRPCWSYKVGILAKRLGYTPVEFQLKYSAEQSKMSPRNVSDVPDEHEGSLGVIVLRPWRLVDVLFRGVLATVIISLNLGFGCALDLTIVREILKRPIAPAIGACCQFICMPLLGILVTKSMRMDNILAFGLLCLSCSPGGGGSNVWSVLLHGDVNLSLTMTFLSLVACLGTMPFWIFTLSRFYVDPSIVKIPFKDIIVTLMSFVVPCFIGILIRKWRTGVADRIARMVKPVAILFVFFVFGVSPYVNNYIYKIMAQTPMVVPPAMLLPWCGFTIGFLAAKFFKQPTYRAITIAIETGIQNFSIALVLLQQSFPQPFGELGATMPLIVAHFTPLPLLMAFIALTLRDRLIKPWLARRNKAMGLEDAEKAKLDYGAEGAELARAPLNGEVISAIEVKADYTKMPLLDERPEEAEKAKSEGRAEEADIRRTPFTNGAPRLTIGDVTRLEAGNRKVQRNDERSKTAELSKGEHPRVANGDVKRSREDVVMTNDLLKQMQKDLSDLLARETVL